MRFQIKIMFPELTANKNQNFVHDFRQIISSFSPTGSKTVDQQVNVVLSSQFISSHALDEHCHQYCQKLEFRFQCKLAKTVDSC